MHASTNLRLALRRVRDLLAPGGVLVLIESTTHLTWFDMTTGLIEGWQHFTDDLRADNPLLPADAWIKALNEAGFEAAEAWPGAGSTADALGQHVIVARDGGGALRGDRNRGSVGSRPGESRRVDSRRRRTAESSDSSKQRAAGRCRAVIGSRFCATSCASASCGC